MKGSTQLHWLVVQFEEAIITQTDSQSYIAQVYYSWFSSRKWEVNSYPFIDAKLQGQGHMNLGVTMHTNTHTIIYHGKVPK